MCLGTLIFFLWGCRRLKLSVYLDYFSYVFWVEDRRFSFGYKNFLE